MSKTQAAIGNALLTSLVELKQRSGGELNIEDVGALFESIASSIPSENNLLQREIGKIADYIAQAKKEISSIAPDEDDKKNIGLAGEELDEVIQTTEQAANDIMDAADVIMEKASLVTDTTVAGDISTAVENIYNACNFQDLTGQRIRKVMKTLEYIDFKINRLMDFANGKISFIDTADEEKFIDKRSDADLLNGPQKNGSVPTQADIDALFGS